MQRVELVIATEALGETMAEIRHWLDRHRCNCSWFTLKSMAQETALVFDFDEAAQARAFAERFAGRMVAPGPV